MAKKIRRGTGNVVESFEVDGAKVLGSTWRNFSGRPTDINPEGGKRAFSIQIDDIDFAKALLAKGWNLEETYYGKEEDDEPSYILKNIHVRFDRRHLGDDNEWHNMEVYIANDESKTLTPLTEKTIGLLDKASLDNVWLQIGGWEYEPGKIAAYLNEGCFSVKPRRTPGRFAGYTVAGEDVIDDDLAVPDNVEDEDLPF